MSKYIAKRGEEAVSKTDILLIAAKAKVDQKKGNKVINASIGTFLNDDKTLNGVTPIKEDLSKHITDDLSYPSTTGPKEYKEAILGWVLKDQLSRIESSFYIPFGATLGGTGAIFISFGTFLDEGDTVILPSPMWGNYKQIATKCGLKHTEYPLVDNKGAFNLGGLKEKIEEVKKIQERVLIVINDPCENPTGYCMDDNDYQGLFSLLESEGQTCTLSVLFDIAYMDYQTFGKGVHQVFELASQKKNSFLPCFSFSCSKSFGVYGLRCGALFAFASEEDTSKEMVSSIGSFARGIYSCPDGPALNSISHTLKDPTKQEQLSKEIYHNSEVLRDRGCYAVSLLDEAKIEHFPYSEGFFITIKVKDAFKLADKLVELHSYVVPLEDHLIRLALSGMNKGEIAELVKQIKENI